jgi:hypothetical protein
MYRHLMRSTSDLSRRAVLGRVATATSAYRLTGDAGA